MFRHIRSLSIVSMVLAAMCAWPARAQFTDVTASSGVGAIVTSRYASHPNW